MSIEAGDKYKVDYPFKFEQYKESSDSFFGLGVEDYSVWLAGCHLSVEDGCQIAEGYYEQCHNYYCDAVGSVEYEILAVVPLGDKLTDRVIYRKTYYYPDGKVKKFSPEMMTVTLLESRLKHPFKVEYEIEPSKEALLNLEDE